LNLEFQPGRLICYLHQRRFGADQGFDTPVTTWPVVVLLTPSPHKLKTESFNLLAGLNLTTFFVGTITVSPVLGFRVG